ncbi:subunit 17 of mediator complex-domain-containing protein [Hypoxylon sp. FL1150]|nr:subunit 17 of mediator complex-domain-containing protein [Hypoxylon sp. FL1150]
MTAPNSSPFSLRPWPIGDKKPKNLGEFIARVNAEKGGFRNVTEEKLREAIAAEEDGRAEIERPSSSSSSEEEETDADKTKNILEARDEVLKNLEVAHQSAMLSLDFVSLLLSKERPSDTSLPLSEALRERVGIGTLGATKLKDSNVTEARRHEDLAIATGWRLMGVNSMVDSVVAAAEKLEKEMEREAKYWADVMAVSESGWAVCALPHEKHTLGVRFGFSESAAEFRDNSIAPLRRNDDGTVRIDLGRVGSGSQRVRITLKRNGVIMDQSPLPGRTPDDAPVQDRVLEARNTVFHQELWYEMNREARNLLSSNVYSNATSITWKQDPETEVIFTLEDLAEPDNTYENLSSLQCSCTAWSFFMQFLLYQGHRQNYYRRTTTTQPPPPRVAMHQPYAILRAIIANSEYFQDCQSFAAFLNDTAATLRRAGLSTASSKSASQPLFPALAMQGGGSGATRYNSKMELNFVNFLAGRLESAFELTITPEAKIYARGRIVIMPYIGVLFGISLAPFTPQPANNTTNATTNNIHSVSAASEEPKDRTPPNPLEISYPPTDPSNPYPNAREAIHYIRQATKRAITHHLVSEASKTLQRDDIIWTETVRGPAVSDRDDKEARVNVVESADGRLELSLDAQWQSGKNTERRRWVWRAGGSGETETITEALVKVLKDRPDLSTEEE